MNDITNIVAYDQGYTAGRDNADARSCPYESLVLTMDWLDGWYDGLMEYRRIVNSE